MSHKQLVEICNLNTELDLLKTNWLPICVNGIQWFVAESITVNNTTGLETSSVKIYKQGVNGTITTTAPIGILSGQEGYCKTQRIHENFVITGTTPLVIPAGLISMSVTKTNNTGTVNISGNNAVNYPLTVLNENFSDGVMESVSTLSSYTITGSAAGTTYKVHIIR